MFVRLAAATGVALALAVVSAPVAGQLCYDVDVDVDVDVVVVVNGEALVDEQACTPIG